ELFRTKPPAAPQPARPRIELFGGRGASTGGTAGAARTGSASGASPYAGSPYAGAAHPATPSKKQEA
ncbi:chemoreceptor glutamine deamidase CheD, partial [Burkholderia multivorans]|nr:chemoreceptor glutamine deamidase CheD [Burkholderia multivorans]